MTDFPPFLDKDNNSYGVILIIQDGLIKMVQFIAIKSTIDVLGLAKDIHHLVLKHYNFEDLMISDCKSLFKLKS